MGRSRQAAEGTGGEAVAHGRDRLRRRAFAPALLAAGLLAGCSAAPTPTGVETPRPAPHAVAARPALAPAALRLPNLDQLDGLRPSELVALFGQPDFRRVEPPAELWQYRSALCVLDLFLYREAGGIHVIHSEMRNRSGHPGSAPCAGVPGRFDRQHRQSQL